MSQWIKDSIFYHIYPLGLCGAPKQNNYKTEPEFRINELYPWIEHIHNMGFNALYLGPVFESKTHGYDTTDYYTVDRRLGDNRSLKDFISFCHDKGVKVILDAVFNHTGRDFAPFMDVQLNGRYSTYKNWFSGLDFNGCSPLGDPFSYESWNGHYELVKLNLENPEVINHLLSAVEMWIKEFDIDGLRIDAADCVDPEFLKKLKTFCKSIKPDFWIMGELIHGDYRELIESAALDSATNYECYKGLYSSHNDINYFEIAYSLNRQFGEGGIYKNLVLYNFADNHDVNRIASTLNFKAHIYPLHILLFTMPGLPSIYYGSEFEIRGIKNNGNDYGLRPELDLSNIFGQQDQGLSKTIAKLIALRKKLKALNFGSYRQLYVNHQQFAFLRELEEQRVITLVNASSDKTAVTVDVDLPEGTIFTDVLNGNKNYTVKNKQLLIDPVWPTWGKILVHDKNQRF